jgi:hypothetical protein
VPSIAASDSAAVAKVRYCLLDPSVVVVQQLLDGGVIPRWAGQVCRVGAGHACTRRRWRL